MTCRVCHKPLPLCEASAYGSVCENCWADTAQRGGIGPPRGLPNVPEGWSIHRLTRQQGIGDGKDYFGNHT